MRIIILIVALVFVGAFTVLAPILLLESIASITFWVFVMLCVLVCGTSMGVCLEVYRNTGELLWVVKLCSVGIGIALILFSWIASDNTADTLLLFGELCVSVLLILGQSFALFREWVKYYEKKTGKEYW